jgi:hypothetical protein
MNICHRGISLNGIQGILNSHIETATNLKGSVLPILERLHKEIKNKSKELASGAAKGAKEVDKVRNITQKHIELLGQQTANYASSGGKMAASEDPYVVQRGIFHRLNKQVLEENNNRHDLLAVQVNFATFESHVVEVIQQALMSFNQFAGGQAQKDQMNLGDILQCAQAIPLDLEWMKFNVRSAHLLIDPSAPDRSVDQISFPNQDHKSTKPLIEGTLERKSRNKLSFSPYFTGYYVVTPSKFLHQFKDNDNFRNDPTPELSIYLPEATIGSPSDNKFNVKGKDISKGLSGKLSGTPELSFKAHTAQDANKWFDIIRAVAGAAPGTAYESVPASPATPEEKRVISSPPIYAEKSGSGSGSSATAQKPLGLKTSNITGGETVASPSSASR